VTADDRVGLLAFIDKPQRRSFRIEDAQAYGTETELVVFVLSPGGPPMERGKASALL
jgi:hypothetical protein